MSGRFRITCPRCGREGGAKAEPSVGAKVRCPGCKAQFAYARDDDFVVVEPRPDDAKPHEWPEPKGDDPYVGAGISLMAVGVVAAVILLILVAASKGSPVAGNLAAIVLIPFVVLSPIVLIGCVVFLVIKHAVKDALREVDAERAKADKP